MLSASASDCISGPLSVDALVVGAGFAGFAAVRCLQKRSVHVLLVDAKPVFEYTPSILRAVVKPGAISHITAEIQRNDKIPTRFSFLNATVVEIQQTQALLLIPAQENAVQTEQQLAILFKVCIWAGGTHYAHPIKPLQQYGCDYVHRRKLELETNLKAIRTAQQILVIGGGIVGVELAAELATRLPPGTTDRVITLASASPRLLPRLPRRAGLLAERFLAKHGVRFVLARVRRVEEPTEKLAPYDHQHTVTFETEGISPAVRLNVNIVFDCSGAVRNPRDGAIHKLVESLSTDGSTTVFAGRAGMVRVRDTLQLHGLDHIFVAGDAALVEDELALRNEGGKGCEKTAYAAMQAGTLAAENAFRMLQSQSSEGRSPSLMRYPTDAFPHPLFPRLFVVSFGRWDGALCIGPIVIGGVISAVTKFILERLTLIAVRRGGISVRVLQLLEHISFYVASALDKSSNGFKGELTREPIDVDAKQT